MAVFMLLSANALVAGGRRDDCVGGNRHSQETAERG
jgi:hypothetical protein